MGDVILLTSGRTGSTLLLRILEQFRGVANAEEPLMSRVPHVSMALRRQRARAVLAGNRWLAWALHPPHLIRNHVADEEGFVGSLHARGARLVTITRRNVVEQALSALVRSTNADRFHFEDGAETVGSKPVDPYRVLRGVDRIELENRRVREWAGLYDHVSLVYEEHIAGANALAATIELLRQYVGLPQTDVDVPLSKRRTPLVAQIPNMALVRSVLEAAGHGDKVEELT